MILPRWNQKKIKKRHKKKIVWENMRLHALICWRICVCFSFRWSRNVNFYYSVISVPYGFLIKVEKGRLWHIEIGRRTTKTHVLTPHYQFISIKYVNSFWAYGFYSFLFRGLIIISKREYLMSFGQFVHNWRPPSSHSQGLQLIYIYVYTVNCKYTDVAGRHAGVWAQ